jgi:hypothetical protein
LSQLGAVASARFADRTRQIGLTPSDAGNRVLRKLRGIAEQHETELLKPLTAQQIA